MTSPIQFRKSTMQNGVDILTVVYDPQDARLTPYQQRLEAIQTIYSIRLLLGRPDAKNGIETGAFSEAWIEQHASGRKTFDGLPTEADLWAWIEAAVVAEESRWKRHMAPQRAGGGRRNLPRMRNAIQCP
jgi:hypothetical protein